MAAVDPEVVAHLDATGRRAAVTADLVSVVALLVESHVGVSVATPGNSADVAAPVVVPGVAVVALLRDLHLAVAAHGRDDVALVVALRSFGPIVRAPVAGLPLVHLPVTALLRLRLARDRALDTRLAVLGTEVARLRWQTTSRDLLLAVAAHGRLQLADAVALVAPIALLARLDRVVAARRELGLAVDRAELADHAVLGAEVALLVRLDRAVAADRASCGGVSVTTSRLRVRDAAERHGADGHDGHCRQNASEPLDLHLFPPSFGGSPPSLDCLRTSNRPDLFRPCGKTGLIGRGNPRVKGVRT